MAKFLFPIPQWFDESGNPLNGGLIFSYQGGSVTPQATWSESTGSSLNSNPIVLSASGRAQIWLSQASYKFVIQTAGGATIMTIDGYNPDLLSSTVTSLTSTGDVTMQQSTAATSGANQSSKNLKIQATFWDGAASQIDQWNIQDVLGTGANPTSTLTVTHSGSSGTVTLNVPSAAVTLGGPFTYKSLNGFARVMADQYSDIQAAINALPSTGGIVDATSPNVNLTMGAIDTGSNTKIVTLLLGPYTYTFTQITARQGFNILGAGLINTTLSNVGTNANPAFVIPQVNNNEIIFHWANFNVTALAGNTSQDGMFFDGSTLTSAGVELGTFVNIQLTGFKGAGIHLKATLDGASGSVGAIQGLTFINVTSIRPTGATGATQNALRIEGGCGQIEFINCWFTGASNDTGTNVFVGTTGTQAPYSIHFRGTTNQNGNAYTIDGGTSITFIDDHFENLKGCWNLLNTSQLVVGVNIKTPHINANVAVNSGNGYVITIPNTVTNCEVVLDTPLVYGTPDKLVNNLAGNSASVQVINARTFNSSTPANVFATAGVTGTLTPAATVDLKGWRSIQVSASGTSMSTFKSTISPGETITLYASGGTIQFATGGNLSLGGNSSPLIVPSGDAATFMRVDAGTPVFILTGFTRGTNALINAAATGAGSGNAITLLNSQDTLANITGDGTDKTVYTYTIPANTVQAGKGIRVRMHAISNNAVNCTWKVTLGSTSATLGTSTGNSNYDVTVEIFNNAGVQNAQRGMAFGLEATAVLTNTTFTMAENLANALALKITANEANPNTVTPHKWYVELIQ